MARYPMPNEINMTSGLQQIPSYIQIVTGGLFMNLLLFAIAIIVGSAYWFVRRDFLGSLATGTFVAWTFAFLFWIAGWIGILNFIFVTACLILSVALLWLTDNG